VVALPRAVAQQDRLVVVDARVERVDRGLTLLLRELLPAEAVAHGHDRVRLELPALEDDAHVLRLERDVRLVAEERDEEELGALEWGAGVRGAARVRERG